MFSFNLFISNFHFVRPYWLLAIFALLFVLWLLKKHRFYQSPWQQFLPNHLSQVLVEGASNTASNKKNKGKQTFLIKPFIIGFLSIIALAGPTWQKLPQPVYQTERGSVLIMDMSYSMYSTDVKPNRLTRARFKAIDLLNKINEGDTGLIAYAGDAFVISPLTQDIKNIELLLPSLTPEIMPDLGANPLPALVLAHEMLQNAGHLNGDIYWFTDDVDNEELTDIYNWSNEFGHQLNILGVGSENGAPITLPSGELLKDSKGAIIVPRLPSQKLKSLASRGHGNYQTISHDDSDIDNLILKDEISQRNKEEQQSQQTGDQWQEQGAWLLVLVLPLMLGYFRRGSTLLILPLSCFPLLFLLSLSAISPVSFAAENTAQEKNPINTSQANTFNKLWQNLWQTNDQQAQKHYNQENYQGAAEQFENSQWQGSAHYKAGNYQEALDAYKTGEQANSANSLYNQGNALAQMQQYEKAIESYEQALTKNPDLQDAKDNIEKIKQQQKEQEQQQGDQSKNDQSQDQNQDQDKKEKDQQQNSEDSQSQDSQDEQSQEQQDQQQSEDSQQQDSESKPQEGDKEAGKEQKEKEAAEKQQNAEQDEKSEEQGEEKTAAQIAAEQQAKETDQKHQQLLNKVTDDPYLLLRNKMQLEYQKRKQDGANRGVKKKW